MTDAKATAAYRQLMVELDVEARKLAKRPLPACPLVDNALDAIDLTEKMQAAGELREIAGPLHEALKTIARHMPPGVRADAVACLHLGYAFAGFEEMARARERIARAQPAPPAVEPLDVSEEMDAEFGAAKRPSKPDDE